MLSRARTLLLAALAATGLAAEPAAGAATVSRVDASTLRYEGDAARDPVQLSLFNADTQVRFEFLPGRARQDVVPVSPCVFQFAAPSTDPDVLCPRGSTARITVDLKDGNDSVNANPFGSVFPIAVIADGGPGNDFLSGSAAADVFRGGEGGDSLTGNVGGDDLGGGPGFDRVSYGGNTPVRVSIDDAADDGIASGAEGDNVRTDVEDLLGSRGDDVLFGSAAGNSLDAWDGNDFIDGGGGTDEFLLGPGNDEARARDGNGERVLCDQGTDTVIADDTDEPADCESFQASGELVRDLDKDGIAKPEDCKDDDPAIRPGVTDVPDDGVDQNCDGVDARRTDLDGDGVARPFDCDDGNAAIRPGAREVFGNNVDEDCTGRADPLQTISTPVLSRFVAGNRATRVGRLLVTDLGAGMVVDMRCTGRRCPFRARTLPVRSPTARLNLRSRLRLRSLRGTGVLEVRVLREDSIGRVARFRFRAGTLPRIDFLCMSPADRAPRRC